MIRKMNKLRIGPVMLGMLVIAGWVATCQAEDDDFVRVQIKGKLKTGMMAIGGETTGTIIRAGDIVYELDCSANKEILASLERLDGKTVYVSGKLQLKRGVEIRQRWIVKVDGLSTRNFFKKSKKSSSVLDGQGQLKHAFSLRLAQGGFAGFSGHLFSIKKDGSWTRRPFLNQNVRAADAKGKLKKEQLKKLDEILSQHKIMQLPKTFGMQVGANPEKLTIRFGEFSAQATLPPGPNDPERLGEKHDAAKRMLRAVKAIRGLLNQ